MTIVPDLLNFLSMGKGVNKCIFVFKNKMAGIEEEERKAQFCLEQVEKLKVCWSNE